jgi:hypothetical protein
MAQDSGNTLAVDREADADLGRNSGPEWPAVTMLEARNASDGMTVDRPWGVEDSTPTWSGAHCSHVRPTTAALLAEAVAAAVQSLRVLDKQAHDAALDFAAGRSGPALASLGHLVQSLRAVLKLVAMAAHVAGTDIHTLCCAIGSEADSETERALDHLTVALVARDLDALARVLDTGFVIALSEWRGVFEALGRCE